MILMGAKVRHMVQYIQGKVKLVNTFVRMRCKGGVELWRWMGLLLLFLSMYRRCAFESFRGGEWLVGSSTVDDLGAGSR